MYRVILFILLACFQNIMTQSFGKWISVDTLNVRRSSLAAVKLYNGEVLVTGGENGQILSSAEIYNPVTGEWRFTTPMNEARYNHTMVELPDSTIMVIGGNDNNKSCEIYNPLTETWTYTDSIKLPRWAFDYKTASLYDGRIMIMGGFILPSLKQKGYFTAECEVYDPQKREWEIADSLNYPRNEHGVTELKSGRILVVGGGSGEEGIKSCEIYDPAKGEWELTGSLNVGRTEASVITLSNGLVMAAGGINRDIHPPYSWLDDVEIFDEQSGTWVEVTPLIFSRPGGSVFQMNDSTVQIVGGDISNEVYEFYDIKNFKPIDFDYYPARKLGQRFVIVEKRGIVGVGGDEYYFDVTGMPILSVTNLCEYYDLVKTEVLLQKKSGLESNSLSLYPNPFNISAKLQYKLSAAGRAKILIFNLLGEKVEILYNDYQSAGKHEVLIDGNNLTSGTYIIRLETENGSFSRKAILLK